MLPKRILMGCKQLYLRVDHADTILLHGLATVPRKTSAIHHQSLHCEGSNVLASGDALFLHMIIAPECVLPDPDVAHTLGVGMIQHSEFLCCELALACGAGACLRMVFEWQTNK